MQLSDLRRLMKQPCWCQYSSRDGAGLARQFPQTSSAQKANKLKPTKHCGLELLIWFGISAHLGALY